MRLQRSLFLACLVSISIPTTGFSDDFRSSNWGDSQAKVLQAAGEPVQENDALLAYEVSISGLDAYLLYQFVTDKLTSAGYMFTESHSNKNSYISDYKNINELLAQKYGKPISEDSVWLNDLYRDDPSQYGFAVSLGHYIKQSSWETDETKIMHTVSGDNYEISHGIMYSSKELESLSDDEDAKKALDQL